MYESENVTMPLNSKAVRENEADHCTMHDKCNTPCVQFWWKWGEAWTRETLVTQDQ